MALPVTPDASDRRALLLALVVGGMHAAGIAALVTRLDYPIGGLATAPGGIAGALVGLTALLTIPTFLGLRHRLVLPFVAATLAMGWGVYRELTTPAPEFSTLGGYTVVNGARYVDAAVDSWYVWLFVALLVGLLEAVARLDFDRLPVPERAVSLAFLHDRDTSSALQVALVVAVAHAMVMLGLATDAGYFEPDGFLPEPWFVGLALLAWTVVGLVVVGGLPTFLLVRWRLLTPTVGLAWLARQAGWAQQLPLPDDPLPIYFIGWFFFAGGLLAVGIVEVGVRAGWRRVRRRRSA